MPVLKEDGVLLGTLYWHSKGVEVRAIQFGNISESVCSHFTGWLKQTG